eukprot:XP_001708943.1 Hypothetical protein GL50803_32043 [Giardia lamblia ATCC 50803]
MSAHPFVKIVRVQGDGLHRQAFHLKGKEPPRPTVM